MYQQYILSGFKPKKTYKNFNDQNILNLSKNVSFEVLCY